MLAKKAFWNLKHSQVTFSALRCFGHHAQVVHKPEPNQKFIQPVDKRFLVLSGMKGTNPGTAALENPFRHHNDKGLLHHDHCFSGYPYSHTFEEEHSVHDESYGYENGDDPFEPYGKGDYPYLIIFFMIIGFFHLNWAHFQFTHRKTGEVLYHQRLTAFQLEDEIRKIREEEAKLHK